jgi:hypothetical protein
VAVTLWVVADVLEELELGAAAALEVLELLLPHAASRHAASSAAATVEGKRAGIAGPNGSEAWAGEG